MNKVDIVRAASAKSGYRQLDVAEMFDAVLEVMHEAVLNKDTIYLQGIGRIATVLAPSRPVYDPRQKCMIHTIADRMANGWSDDPFFQAWVRYANVANGDKNEFYVPNTALLQVSKFAGNHHDLDRQKVLPGRAFSIPTSWYGIKVYADWEEFAMGRIDWADLTDRMYRSISQARMDAVFAMFNNLKKVAPTDMKLDVNTSSTTVQDIVALSLTKRVASLQALWMILGLYQLN